MKELAKIKRINHSKVVAAKEVDWIYLAGLFDGEGTVSFMTCKKKSKSGHPYTKIHLNLTSTDSPLIEWLVDTFGGSSTIKKPYNPKHREAYQWCVASRHARDIAEKLLPYVKLKKEHLELVKLYSSTIAVNSHYGISPTARGTRSYIAERMTILNRRGAYA